MQVYNSCLIAVWNKLKYLPANVESYKNNQNFDSYNITLSVYLVGCVFR